MHSRAKYRVSPTRIELVAYRLGGGRSIRLSYGDLRSQGYLALCYYWPHTPRCLVDGLRNPGLGLGFCFHQSYSTVTNHAGGFSQPVCYTFSSTPRRYVGGLRNPGLGRGFCFHQPSGLPNSPFASLRIGGNCAAAIRPILNCRMMLG
jgi:hypothetical protein